MTVRLALLLLAAILFPSVLLGQPNVVILIADDLGWNDVGYHNPEVRTPNIDALARKGVELDRFYVNPTCSPTRASLMTGMFATSHGVISPVQAHTEEGLPLEYRLLPEYFREAGYSTHLAGKWHLGHRDRAYHPLSRGFDSFYGFLGGGIGYYDHVYAGAVDWQRDGVTVFEEGYATELIAAEAERVVRQRGGRPFFLMVSFNAPHTPIEGPGGPSRGHLGRATYLEMIGSLDDAVGRLLEALEAEGILDDTMLVFFSDNGGMTPAPFWKEWLLPPLRDGYGSNQPLREGKGSVLEGGIRVPAAIWWPGTQDSTQALAQPIHVADLLPTLASVAGFEVPKVDGEDLWAAIRALRPRPRPPLVMASIGSEALIDWPWKLARIASPPFVPDWLAGEDFQLFNLAQDPGETRDLSERHPAVFEDLRQKLDNRPRRTTVRLDMSQDMDVFGGEITRPPWAEAATGAPFQRP